MNPTDGADTSDRLALRELIERYFHALDARDRGVLSSCFTGDASAVYFYGTPQETPFTGGASIVDNFMAVMSRFDASTHLTASVMLELSGETGGGDTFAVAHLVVGGKVLVRGLRYQDRFVRGETGWRISDRRHIPLWQYEAPAAALSVPQ